MNKYITSLIVVTVLTLGLWSYTQAVANEISICVKKDGAVHVIGADFKRDDCNKKETLLTWNIAGQKGDKGEQGIQGVQGEIGLQGSPATSLHLYDANGQDLGILIDHSASYVFTTYFSNPKVFLTFTQNRGLDNQTTINVGPSGGILFPQQDCTGTPYTNDNQSPYTGKMAGSRLFRYTAGDIITGQPQVSYLESTVCNNVILGGANFYPLEEIPLPFTLPLAWPLDVK